MPSGDELGRCCIDVATAPMTRQGGHQADSEARDHQKPGSDAHTEGSETSKPQHDDQTCGSCDADQHCRARHMAASHARQRRAVGSGSGHGVMVAPAPLRCIRVDR
ncbi:MAG: hypothetical protein ACLGIZ_12870 [Acidimicrobiia bacterium]|jgi:hypothetical protein